MIRFLRTDPTFAGGNYKPGELPGGPYLAVVKAVGDPTKNNRVSVAFAKDTKDGDDPTSWMDVTIALPSYGLTPFRSGSSSRSKEPHDGGTSYGLHVPEPDVGTYCLVSFADGRRDQGYIIAFVPSPYNNATVSGRGVSQPKENIEFSAEDKEEWYNTAKEFPVIEKNLKSTTSSNPHDINILKYGFDRLMTGILFAQGLWQDTIRGITSTSPHRESPNKIISLQTPGRRLPDPQDNPELLKKFEENVYALEKSELDVLTRKPGHVLAMDDGEDNGKNSLVRLRSGAGHQILLNDSEGLIYIINAQGTAWVEMTKSGKLDIYSADSVSIHSGADFNLTADRDFNISAGGDMNVAIGGDIKHNSGRDYSITSAKTYKTNIGESITNRAGTFNANYAGTNQTMVAQGTTNILSKGVMSLHGTADIGIEADGGNILTKATQIHLNSPSNEPAVHSADIPLTAEEAQPTARVPQHEPWDQHENLDPLAFSSFSTSAGTEQQSVYYDANGNLQYKNDPNTSGAQ